MVHAEVRSEVEMKSHRKRLAEVVLTAEQGSPANLDRHYVVSFEKGWVYCCYFEENETVELKSH